MIKRALIIAIPIIGCILGYGYWHSATHASFHIHLDFKDTDRQKLKTIPKAEVLFLDSEGRVLARGISDEQYSYVHLIHPEVGDCHKVEKMARSLKAAPKSWQECFEHLSTWIPQWADKVRQVDLKAQDCIVKYNRGRKKLCKLNTKPSG